MSTDRDSSVEVGNVAHPVVPILIGLVVVAGGGYFYYSGVQATANAEEVDATVLTSTVVDNGDTAGEDAEEFSVKVEYRFTYGGETYTSEQLCPGAGSACEPSGDFRTEMREFLEDYPEGGTVTAYVPPSDPEGAFLIDSGPSSVYLGVAGAGLLLVVLGVYRLFGE